MDGNPAVLCHLPGAFLRLHDSPAADYRRPEFNLLAGGCGSLRPLREPALQPSAIAGSNHYYCLTGFRQRRSLCVPGMTFTQPNECKQVNLNGCNRVEEAY